ncbi:hypothetical protein ACIA8O_21700 [Kitasatospora sp. NPDC051853]|uniref:hypothetical protein n=1 Tax=Kitasatospora sp. NPDC051853 TaxID=3364058 RepID=UPI003796C356
MRGEPSGDGPDPPHLRELAQFLSVHLHRAPGVLWPEHDHPVLAAAPCPEAPARLAAGLARRTGLPARPGTALRQGPNRGDDGAGGGQHEAPAHLIVHQTAGAGVWHLSRGSGPDAESFRYRLRTGEVLYAPAGWAYRVDLTARARFVATLIEDAGHPPHEVSPPSSLA